MRASTKSVAILSIIFALFLLFAGFFAVHCDQGPKSIWKTQPRSQEQQEQVEITLKYLNNRVGNEEDLSFYTAEETSHLKDVRILFNAARIIFALLTLILILSGIFAWRKWRREIRKKKERAVKKGEARSVFKQVLFWGGAGGLGLVLLLALLSLLDFSWFWSGPFHALLFPQGNWMFPANSVLITLFPETFFRRFAGNVLLAAGSFGVVALLAGHRSDAVTAGSTPSRRRARPGWR